MKIAQHLIRWGRRFATGARCSPGLICLQPFYFMELTPTGEAFPCCPAFAKFSLGNLKTQTIDEVWNSDRARHIRRKMYRGEWQDICDPICPHLSAYRHNNNPILYKHLDSCDFLTPGITEEIRRRKDHLESPPTVYNFSNSKVCNLSCIMCPQGQLTDDPALMEKIAQDVSQHLYAARKLILTGMGDPLARPDTRNLLINFKTQNPDLKFDLMTNALLLPQYWDRIKHQTFDILTISVDAATKETYEKIRAGGSWETLLQSLSLVKENRNAFRCIALSMTVMRENYREIPHFIDFAESYGFSVGFHRIRGLCHNQNFFEANDANALRELKDIIIAERSKKRAVGVFWGDLLNVVSREHNT